MSKYNSSKLDPIDWFLMELSAKDRESETLQCVAEDITKDILKMINLCKDSPTLSDRRLCRNWKENFGNYCIRRETHSTLQKKGLEDEKHTSCTIFIRSRKP